MARVPTMDSILVSIKKTLGIDYSYTVFDDILILHINSVFAQLTQLGIGPKEGFLIEGDGETWDEFIDEEEYPLYMIKSYVYLKVRMLFDPPTNASLIESMNRQINEFEWRIEVAGQPNDE